MEVTSMLHLNRFASGSIGIILGTLLVFGCAQQEDKQKKKKVDKGPKVTEAVATIHAVEGEDISGAVTFTKTDDGTEVQAELENLSSGKHGFHIHQHGNCSDRESFASAGGHYNPTDQSHGAPTADQRHVGDMGNIPVGSDGLGELTYTDNIIKLNGKHSVVGHAVVLHAGEDDFESQPSGDAGSRIGCGIIGINSTKSDTAKGDKM